MQQIFYIHYANRYDPPLRRMFPRCGGCSVDLQSTEE